MAQTSQDSDRVANLWAEYQPRIEQARRRDAEGSTLPFVELHEERIGDFPAVILNIQKYLLLQQAGVFEGKGDKTVNDVLIFLWIVHPEFVAEPLRSKAFFKEHAKIDLQAYATQITDYLGSMFQMMPGKESGKSGGGSNKDWVASLVDLIASEYGWPEKEILNIPLPRLFQYVSRITQRLSGSPVSFSKEADRLQAEFMEKANTDQEDGASG